MDTLAKNSDVTVGAFAVPPRTEYKGMALYIGANIAVLVFFLWSLSPTWLLHYLHIYYFPSRWWALAIPSWLIAAFIFTYVFLALYNIEVMTCPLDQLEVVVDEHARVKGGKNGEYFWEATDGVWDLPLVDVCKVLYCSEEEEEAGGLIVEDVVKMEVIQEVEG